MRAATAQIWAPVAGGAGGGAGGAAAILALARYFGRSLLSSEVGIPAPLQCAADAVDAFAEEGSISHRDLAIFAAGLGVGLCTWPLLDALWLCRRAWNRLVEAVAASLDGPAQTRPQRIRSFALS